MAFCNFHVLSLHSLWTLRFVPNLNPSLQFCVIHIFHQFLQHPLFFEQKWWWYELLLHRSNAWKKVASITSSPYPPTLIIILSARTPLTNDIPWPSSIFVNNSDSKGFSFLDCGTVIGSKNQFLYSSQLNISRDSFPTATIMPQWLLNDALSSHLVMLNKKHSCTHSREYNLFFYTNLCSV